ncbi:hypothetical protein Y032_0002g1058 [Ancylostoma ceylanicum]|uniref:Uncharacterized protein n=1 Tax=Ancylostoma ceylanicum TaxID=53326 RepID=A0A016VYP1_9BILA|nr:hypothetical protein Y032_0002g1058 [Ancylostoma ceylanicum]
MKKPYDISPPGRIPEAVSKYILEYYMRHSEILVNNTNMRTVEANTRRTTLIRRLIEDLKYLYGYEASPRKIKNHFDHLRSKILHKGYAVNYEASKGERRLSKTSGLRPSLAGTPVRKEPFMSPAEEKIWNYYERTPMARSSRGSEVRDCGPSRKLARVSEAGDHSNRYNEPVQRQREDDHFDHVEVHQRRNSSGKRRHSDTALDEIMLDSEKCSDNCSEDASSLSKQYSLTCQAEAEMLKEMRAFYQEQRKFYREMTHMIKEMCSLVKMAKEQILEKSPSNICCSAAKTITVRDNVTEIKAVSLL